MRYNGEESNLQHVWEAHTIKSNIDWFKLKEETQSLSDWFSG